MPLCVPTPRRQAIPPAQPSWEMRARVVRNLLKISARLNLVSAVAVAVAATPPPDHSKLPEFELSGVAVGRAEIRRHE